MLILGNVYARPLTNFNGKDKEKPQDQIVLTSVCSDAPEQFRRWRLHNPTDKYLKVHYEIYKTHVKGQVTLPPAGLGEPRWQGDSLYEYTFIETPTMADPNTMVIKCRGTQQVKASSGEKCKCGQKWSVCGNEAESNNFLGTTNAEDLRIKTNDSLRLVINNETGDVHVLENIRINKDASVANLQIRKLGENKGGQKFVVVDSIGRIDTASVPIKIKNDTIIFENMQIKNELKIGEKTLHMSHEPGYEGVTDENHIYAANGDLSIQSKSGNTGNTFINCETGFVSVGDCNYAGNQKLNISGGLNLDALYLNGTPVTLDVIPANLSEGKTITASSNNADANFAIDGNINTLWTTNATSSLGSEIININLEEINYVDNITLTTNHSSCRLYYSNSGTNFTEAKEVSMIDGTIKYQVSNNSQYIKIIFSYDYPCKIEVAEIEIYSQSQTGKWLRANVGSNDIYYNKGNVSIGNEITDNTSKLIVTGDNNSFGITSTGKIAIYGNGQTGVLAESQSGIALQTIGKSEFNGDCNILGDLDVTGEINGEGLGLWEESSNSDDIYRSAGKVGLGNRPGRMYSRLNVFAEGDIYNDPTENEDCINILGEGNQGLVLGVDSDAGENNNGRSYIQSYKLWQGNAHYHLILNPHGGPNGGRVGIGCINPTEKLSVNGNISVKGIVKAEELKTMDIELADYVFAKDYKLNSLKEVEDYINANSRLPGMPSANHVKQNGLKIGEMSNLLLEKIEELTLYTIDQQKKIDKLTKENEKLKKQNENIKQVQKDIEYLKRKIK